MSQIENKQTYVELKDDSKEDSESKQTEVENSETKQTKVKDSETKEKEVKRWLQNIEFTSNEINQIINEGFRSMELLSLVEEKHLKLWGIKTMRRCKFFKFLRQYNTNKINKIGNKYKWEIKYLENTKDNLEYDTKITIGLFGDRRAGKTSMLDVVRFGHFNEAYDPTTSDSCDFLYIPNYQNKTVQIMVLDSAGHSQHKNEVSQSFKKTDGALFIYDMSNKESRIAIKKYWWKKLNEFNDKNCYSMLVGNKSDIIKIKDLENSTKDGTNMAQKLGLQFRSVSCKSDHDAVKQVFKELIDNVIKRNITEDELELTSINLSQPIVQKSDKGCQCQKKQTVNE